MARVSTSRGIRARLIAVPSSSISVENSFW